MDTKIILLMTQIKSFNKGVVALNYGHLELLKNDFQYSKVYCYMLGKENMESSIEIDIAGRKIVLIQKIIDWRAFIFLHLS